MIDPKELSEMERLASNASTVGTALELRDYCTPDRILRLCARIRELEEALSDADQLIRHGLEMEHFTPGGSTAGWAGDVISKIEVLK